MKPAVKTLTRVDSSMIYAFGYDEKEEILEVVFTKGGIWRYYDVPKEIYTGLQKAKSVGSYMRESVLDCFEEEKL